MFTKVTQNTRRTISAAAAVAVVAFAGLTLDQGHLRALPQGSVEVGELTPVNLMQMAAVTLPEIVISGQRVEASRHYASTGRDPLLPALVTAAGKALLDVRDTDPARAAPAASVLLK